MILKIHPDNPSQNKISKVVELLLDGEVIIYPTDSVYAFGCDPNNKTAVKKLCQIKGVDLNEAYFTYICEDISQVSQLTKQLDNSIFKLIKKNTPGPFTFILSTANNVPTFVKSKKDTIGIRIPDGNIAQAIISQLGRPLLSSSIKKEDLTGTYLHDIDEIAEKYKGRIDCFVDGGDGIYVPSAVIDCTGEEVEIVREGPKELQPA